MNLKRAFLLLGLSLILFACGPMVSELEFTSLSDLNSNPAGYENTTVKVQGHVVEFLGEKSHFIALPYVTTRSCKIFDSWSICTDVRISISQVKVAEFLLQAGDQEILVSERSGGLYLPIPFVPASTPRLPEGEIVIVGYWSTKDDGSYVLYVSGADEIATSTPRD